MEHVENRMSIPGAALGTTTITEYWEKVKTEMLNLVKSPSPNPHHKVFLTKSPTHSYKSLAWGVFSRRLAVEQACDSSPFGAKTRVERRAVQSRVEQSGEEKGAGQESYRLWGVGDAVHALVEAPLGLVIPRLVEPDAVLHHALESTHVYGSADSKRKGRNNRYVLASSRKSH